MTASPVTPRPGSDSLRRTDYASGRGIGSVAPSARASRARATWARRLAEFGAATALGGLLGLWLVQRMPSTRAMNPLSEPLSKYALTVDGWLFDVAVLLLALAAAAVAVAVVLVGCATATSVPIVALGCCGLGLTGVVVFPDYTTVTGGFTGIGWTHWAASIAAFTGAPVAALTLARRHRTGVRRSRLLGVGRWLSWFAAAGLTLLVIGTIAGWLSSLPVQNVGGALERVLTATEIAIAAVLAAWSRGIATPILRPLVTSRTE